ncbi:MAG: glycosyltransferase [Patescibacteria group bacterium]|jgi:GT2 family glycosyltransferase
MLLSIIIVSYNTKELLEDCLKSIVASIGQDKSQSPNQQLSLNNIEVIIVDNNSIDGTREYLKQLTAKNFKLKVTTILNEENVGFAKAVNQGIKKAKGEYILLLNSDIRVLPGAINKLIRVIEKKKDAGLVAPKLLNKGGKSSQASCYNLPRLGRAFKEYWLKKKGAFSKYLPRGGHPTVVEAAVGAAMLIPKTTFDLIGTFDEKFFMYYEDLDFCQRLKKAGLVVYYVPQAKVIHYHGASGKKEPQKVNRYLIESSKKYHGPIKHHLISFLIRISAYREIIPLLLAIIGLIVYAVFPLLKFEFFDSHDAFFHLIRLSEFDKAVRAGQIPPRWAPGLAAGLGAPIFNYFYPLVYYLGQAIHFLGFSLAASVRTLFVFGFLVGFTSVFLFLKRHFSHLASFIGALFYVFAPYTFINIYVRGNLPEFLALMILPGVFYFGERASLKERPSWVNNLFFSFCLAFFIMSHNIVALWGTIWLFAYLFILAGKKIVKLIFPTLLGLGLSAFFWLPAILEIPLVHLSTEKVFNWWDHFPTIRQLVYSPWGYGVSLPGPGDTMSFQIGLPHLFLFLSSLVLAVIYLFKKQIKQFISKPKTLWFFLLLSFCFIFLMNHRSAFLWQTVPFLSRVQFPWRFLGFLNFSLVFLIAFLFNAILTFKKKLWINVIVLFFLAILVGAYHSYPKIKRVVSQEKILTSPEATQTTTNANEILPIFAPTDYYRYDFKQSLDCQEFSCQVLVDLEKEEEIVFAKFYFPSWQSNVGQTRPQEETGLLAVVLPKGKHNVLINWQETKIAKTANIISLFSFLATVGYCFWLKNENNKNSN